MIDIAWSWKWPDLGCEILVSASVVEVLNRYRQVGPNPERGGQLFVDPLNPVGLVLADASTPNPADQVGRSWIDMDSSRCRREVVHANSKGMRLVGYWHTHPQIIPHISRTDIESFRRFSTAYNHELPHPIAVIVGTSRKANGIRVWSFRDGRYIEGVRSGYGGN
ncbi:Mov34/MPN/PAD-1 family protein [Marinobacter adhaerens]|nr:Mov34/MPN/PAD-1 family protein [Marinobacter adhaerens]